MERETGKRTKMANAASWSEDVLAARRARRSSAGGTPPTPKPLLERARRHDSRATAELCKLYWQPIRSFLRRQGARDAESNDMTNAFLTGVLDRGDLTKMTPYSFRSWLRTGAKRALYNARARTAAEARLCERAQPELEREFHAKLNDNAEHRLAREETHSFLERVWQGLRERYVTDDELELFEHLKRSIYEEDTELDDAALCLKLKKSKDFVGVRRHRLRTREFPEALLALLRSEGTAPDAPGPRRRWKPGLSEREAILAMLRSLG